MSFSSRDLEVRAHLYADSRNIAIGENLGYGNDGSIWVTNRKTAVKVERNAEVFGRERATYCRLRDLQIEQLAGFWVPRLVDFEEDLWTIEMEIVAPPYLLDFGKAYLDQRPDFTPEVLEDWEAERRELFEVSQWPIVKKVLASLASLGIYYYDVKPGNIQFLEDE